MKTMLLTLTSGLLIIAGCSKKQGCTDSTALNFNKEAEKDDGSCLYKKSCSLAENTILFNNTNIQVSPKQPDSSTYFYVFSNDSTLHLEVLSLVWPKADTKFIAPEDKSLDLWLATTMYIAFGSASIGYWQMAEGSEIKVSVDSSYYLIEFCDQQFHETENKAVSKSVSGKIKVNR